MGMFVCNCLRRMYCHGSCRLRKVLYFLQLVGLLPSLQLLSKEERHPISLLRMSTRHDACDRMLETRDYWGNERSFQVGFLTAEAELV